MEWYYYIIIVLIGIIVGFINVLAGGGSAISLAILLFLGLPANIANGTNRIAILLSTLVGAGNFRYKNIFSVKQNLWLIFPSIVGAIIGAQLAIDVGDIFIEKFTGGILILIFLLLLLKTEIWLKDNTKVFKKKNKWIVGVAFFFIGIYGGFIQVGAGFYFLSLLTMVAGFNIIKSNALKLFIILCYTPFVLFVFIKHQQVDFILGILLGIGTAIGALIGSNIAINKGVKIVRYFVLIILFLFILNYFNVYSYFYIQ